MYIIIALLLIPSFLIAFLANGLSFDDFIPGAISSWSLDSNGDLISLSLMGCAHLGLMHLCFGLSLDLCTFPLWYKIRGTVMLTGFKPSTSYDLDVGYRKLFSFHPQFLNCDGGFSLLPQRMSLSPSAEDVFLFVLGGITSRGTSRCCPTTHIYL